MSVQKFILTLAYSPVIPSVIISFANYKFRKKTIPITISVLYPCYSFATSLLPQVKCLT